MSRYPKMIPKEYKSQCDQCFSDLKKVVKIANGFLNSITLKTSSPTAKKLKLVLLHGMCRKAASLIVLYGSKQFEGIEEIARAIFEGYIDLENLQNDPDNYADFILASSNAQKITFLRGHLQRPEDAHSQKVITELEKNLGVPVAKYISDRKTLIRTICERLPKKYVQISKQGKPLKPCTRLEDKARWAGLDSDYNGFYRLMSPYSHNDVSSLILYVMEPLSQEFEWPPMKGKVPSFAALYVTFTSIRTSTIRIAKSLRKFNGPLRTQLLNIDPKFE